MSQSMVQTAEGVVSKIDADSLAPAVQQGASVQILSEGPTRSVSGMWTQSAPKAVFNMDVSKISDVSPQRTDVLAYRVFREGGVDYLKSVVVKRTQFSPPTNQFVSFPARAVPSPLLQVAADLQPETEGAFGAEPSRARLTGGQWVTAFLPYKEIQKTFTVD